MINEFLLSYAFQTHRTMFYTMPCEPCFILWRTNPQKNDIIKVYNYHLKNERLSFLVNPNPNTNPNPNQQHFSYNYFSWIMHNIWKLFSSYLTCICYIIQFGYTCQRVKWLDIETPSCNTIPKCIIIIISQNQCYYLK